MNQTGLPIRTTASFGRLRQWGVAPSPDRGIRGQAPDRGIPDTVIPDTGIRGQARGQAMGSVGDCYDNAMAESFFTTFECELLERTRFQDHRPSTKGRSSSTSKDGITRTVVTKDWATSPPSTSRGATSKLHDTQALNRPLKWDNSNTWALFCRAFLSVTERMLAPRARIERSRRHCCSVPLRRSAAQLHASWQTKVARCKLPAGIRCNSRGKCETSGCARGSLSRRTPATCSGKMAAFRCSMSSTRCPMWRSALSGCSATRHKASATARLRRR